MNFSKKGVIDKQHQIKSTSKRLNTKLRVTLFRLCLVCVVFVGIVGVLTVSGAVKGMLDNAPDIAQINIDPDRFATHVYYSDGTLADTIIDAGANRVMKTIDEIPDVLEHAFIALEDERFYEHKGIDIRGIFRAGFSVIKTKGLGFGASTITQQLLKNKVFGGGAEENAVDKVVRKIQEQYLAIKLEDEYSKDEILESYLNTINLGNGSYGVQTAAQSYFGKDVEDLTLSESAVIAAIALSPVRQNPIKYPEANAERRQKCLDNMLELGFCTQEEYDEAINDDVYSRISLHAQDKTNNTYYSYYTDEVINQVINDLQEKKGYTAEQAEKLVFSGGLSITSAQDKDIQKIVDKYFTDESNFPAVGEGSYYELNYALSILKEDGSQVHYHLKDLFEYFKDYDDTEGKYLHTSGKKGISSYGYDKEDMIAKTEEFKAAMLGPNDDVADEKISITVQPQTSMTIMDQSTGKVVALYGGRGEKTGNRVLNRATSTTRPVGSTFKVLAAFLPALDSGGYTLASPFDDSEYFYPTGEKVTNWYKGFYKGLSTIREGIYNSMNIVATRTLEAVTPRVGFDYLKKLGFSTLVDEPDQNGRSDVNVSLALGGLTNGVTNLELTAAYAAIANGGVYNKPIFYTKVVDHNGKVLLTNETNSTQVMKSSTAWLLTNAMEDTIKIGTGKRLGFRNYSMPVAGKTGTVHDYWDLWFSGYTPYYTASIWTGFDNNREQSNKTYHQDLWRNIMEEIHSTLNLEKKSFTKPDSIVTASICTKSGKLAVAGLCDHAKGGSTVKTEYFAKGTVPTEYCDVHVKVQICKESGHIASAYCPLDQVEEVVYLVKDSETSTTWDTENLYPTGDKATPCPIHSDGSILPPEEDDTNDDDSWWQDEETDDTNNSGDNAGNNGNSGNTGNNGNTGNSGNSDNSGNNGNGGNSGNSGNSGNTGDNGNDNTVTEPPIVIIPPESDE